QLATDDRLPPGFGGGQTLGGVSRLGFHIELRRRGEERIAARGQILQASIEILERQTIELSDRQVRSRVRWIGFESIQARLDSVQSLHHSSKLIPAEGHFLLEFDVALASCRL